MRLAAQTRPASQRSRYAVIAKVHTTLTTYPVELIYEGRTPSEASALAQAAGAKLLETNSAVRRITYGKPCTVRWSADLKDKESLL